MKLSDEKTTSANIQSTHAIDIVAFVEADAIPFCCFETPYYLSPAPGGEKVYALLREALSRTRKIGIAHVMIQARRRLAALIPCGPVLLLNTLRIAGKLPALVKKNVRSRPALEGKPTEKELAMAAKVVESMTRKWDIDHGADALIASAALPAGPVEILQPAIRPPAAGLITDRTVYQAQRPSRPRSRARRTYH